MKVSNLTVGSAAVLWLMVSGASAQQLEVDHSRIELSDVTGRAGSTIENIQMTGDRYGSLVRTVSILEVYNVPCAILIGPRADEDLDDNYLDNSNQRLDIWRDSPLQHSECGSTVHPTGSGPENQTYGVTVTEPLFYVRGIAVCQTGNGRVKGIKLHVREVNDNGGLSDDTEVRALANCRDNWSTDQFCDADQAVVGLRLHFRQRAQNRSSPLTGLQAFCAPVTLTFERELLQPDLRPMERAPVIRPGGG